MTSDNPERERQQPAPSPPLFANAAVLGLGRAAIACLRLARTIGLARLLGVEDYGIASLFVVALALADMVGDLAFERLIVQDRDGDSPRFNAAIQSLTLVRGLAMAGLMLVLAEPFAAALGHPEIAWALQLFALVPLLRGLAHLDAMREQRRMRFGVSVTAELSGIVLALALAWPLVAVLGDWRVMPCLLAIEIGVRVVLSHALAERRYRLGWQGGVLARALSFGWPLLLSGMIGVTILQGDRVIVGAYFGAFELGLFSAALTLAMTPCLLAANIAHGLTLPLLSRAQERGRLAAPAALTLEGLQAVAALALLGFVVLGPGLVQLLFGEAYAGAATLVALLGAAFALRLARAGPTTAAMALANTRDLLYANLLRLTALPLAVAVAASTASVEAVVAIGVAAEAGALTLSRLLLWRHWRTTPALAAALGSSRAAFVLSLLGAGCVCAGALLESGVLDIAAAALLGLAAAVCRGFWRTLWREASGRLRTARRL